MRGKHHIIVQNNRLRYEFDVKRNLTIIRGESASGKTTLMEMLSQAMNLGISSGIEVHCDKAVRVLGGNDWKVILQSVHDQIVFMDEENGYIRTQEFAAAVKASDCYFVLITREDLPNLPYSVDEIYGIHSSGKYQSTRRVYNELYRIYRTDLSEEKIAPTDLVTEDSNAGYDFFRHIAEQLDITCTSAEGKSNLRDVLKSVHGKAVVGIADGAAIGPEMNELYQLMRIRPEIKCYLPESFEWLILSSGLIDGNEVRDILEHPEDFVESREYFSWERFFTKMLIDNTEGTYQQYNKSQLNSYYVQEAVQKKILTGIRGLMLNTE